MTITKIHIAFIVALALLLMSFSLFYTPPQEATGSIIQGNDYRATTTAADSVYGASVAETVIKSGRGSLGSVVIQGANTAVWHLYDATTTNIIAGNEDRRATTSIHIASFPNGVAAGTYVFDVEFTDGLYLDVTSGVMPTTTITYR